MNRNAIIGLSVAAVFVLLLVWVGATAASMGGEATQVHDTLEAAVHSHSPVTETQSKIGAMGFKLSADPSGKLVGQGPVHSMLVYSSWITVELSSNPSDQTTSGYKMDRGQKWF